MKIQRSPCEFNTCQARLRSNYGRALSFQRGASLIVSLLMLVAVLILGISAAEIALKGEKVSRNDRDRQIAFQAAEAALIDAETDIENINTTSLPANSRTNLFSKYSAIGFNSDCNGTGNYRGLCLRTPDGVSPIWQTVDFENSGVAFGTFTNKTMQVGSGSLPNKLPRYIIELLTFNKEGEASEVNQVTYFYRITAVGFGVRDTTQVGLQSFYRKE